MGFGTPSLQFLRRLKKHNNRDWFEAHRADYETHLREPMRALIADLDARFARFAPEIVGDPRRSMFRIHRDIRFAKDKSPYKTNAGSWFFHAEAQRSVGRDAEGGSAGFYFHLEPGASFVAAGLWMPPPGQLLRLREEMCHNLKSFERVVTDCATVRRFGSLDAAENLKRMPRGYPEDHPAARWLRYRSFTLSRPLTDAQVTSARLATTLAADFERLTLLVRWLNLALGLGPATSRAVSRGKSTPEY